MTLNRILTVVVCLFLLTASMQASIDLPVTEHHLSNGLKILAIERPESSVVAFALYYRGGSIDEVAGKTGIAHYCEHMMFKSTKNLQGESFARLLGAVGGGHSNANTSFDRTCYHATIPSDRLELVIRLEAERMENLQPTREEAGTELAVIKEELRQNYSDDPMGKMRFELYKMAFEQHPYKIITIGKMEDLNTFTYEDLMAFQQKFYCPANAVAVVVGNFDTQNMLDLMTTFFEPIPSGERRTENYTQEPEQTAEKRMKLNMQVQRPILMMGYKTPEATNPDNLALRVLCSILSQGGTSPLGQLSQGDNPVAMQAYAYVRASLDPGLLIFGGLTLPDIPIEQFESRIQAVIDDITANGITQEQLDKARTQMLAQQIYGMQSSIGVAFSLGEAEMVGSWKNALKIEEQLAALTPEMLQKVAVKYLVPEHRSVVIVEPETQKEIGNDQENL